MQKKYALPFAILAGLFLVTLPFTPYPGSFVPKVLPIILLLLIALRASALRGRFFLIAAIFFSGCGDLFLELTFQGAFIAGLASFLTAHLCYIALFAFSFQAQRRWIVFSLLGVALPASMAIFLWPHLGPLQIPVAAYVTAIATMFLASLNRRVVNPWVICGAAFFILSDSILALNRFYAPIPAARYAIMVTYYLAQFLIVTGIADERVPRDFNPKI